MTTSIEHRAVIDELSEVGRDAVANGLVIASGGNLSARLHGRDAFVVTALGSRLDRLSPEDFTTVSSDGRVLEGNPQPSSEWKLHQRTFALRTDVNAIVHVHPQHAVLVDALGHEIRLITLDHAHYVRSVGVVPFYPNGSDALADAAAEQALVHDCVIMSHHGCSALGDTIAMAYRRAQNLEEAAVATYRSLVLGNSTLVFPPKEFERLHHS